MAAEEIENARRLFEAGRLDEALERILVLLEQCEDHRLWEWRGFIHAQQEQWHQGLYALESASILAPLTPAARICLYECYRQTGREALARELVTALIEDVTLPVDLYLALAALLDRVGNTMAATDICNQAVVARPRWARAWFDYAYYLARLDPHNAAIDSAARRAVQLAPHCVSFRLALACRLASQRRIAEAYEWVSRWEAEEIALVCCQDCLRKLHRIYLAANDGQRASLCSTFMISAHAKP